MPHDLVFSDLEAFHRHDRNAYVACAQAVNDELSRHQQAPNAASSNGNAAHNANGKGNATPNGNAKPRSNGRKATVSQVRAIHAIASRLGLDLAVTLQERFGIDYAEDLAIGQASELIDELKGATNGKGGRR